MPEYSLVIDGSEIEIDFDEPVEYYPYRRATVEDRFWERPRDNAANSFERVLASAAGVNLNNHVVYGITLMNGRKLYLLFSDDFVIYGWKVKEELW